MIRSERVVGTNTLMGTITATLGNVESARTRTLARRSSVLVADGTVVVGTADGTVTGFDPETLAERWSTVGGGNIVSLTEFPGGIAVGERDRDGTIRAIDATTGECRWTYAASDDVGSPQKESPNFYPYATDACADDERLYVAVRRMALRNGERRFSSIVYAFDTAGDIRWRYVTDASATSVEVRGGRLAVAYNRCPGEHDRGVVVLDATNGAERTGWDPGGADGDRRVGDAALLPNGIAVTSYGDRRGYVLDDHGSVRWRVDLGTAVRTDGTVVYAYPSHVHATEEAIAFVTGSTYPRDGREPQRRHPNEHRIRCYSRKGERRWDVDARGLTRELAGEDDRLLVPSAQNRWTRDPDVHGVQLFELGDGELRQVATDGIVTAAALSDELFAVVEEPIEYHDDEVTYGRYSLHVGRYPVQD